jgi:NAD(P)-dependent dehydrogenase (short-subunit alcohol dehydrogenase family)
VHTAFITGCQTGFGHRLARRLLFEGYRVIATDACTDGLADRLLEGLEPELCARLSLHDLDVRSGEQVQALARTIDPKVDLVVNNAGFGLFGTQEETDIEQVRDLFDVNVLGPARVTQAFLPHLRATRGTLVQLSSVAGRMVFPESGYYAATKHALDAMSQAVALEACPLGVRVRVVEPGAFATQFYDTAAQHSPERTERSPYQTLHASWDGWREEVLEEPQDPGLVVEAIWASLHSAHPFLRIPVGEDARRILNQVQQMGDDAGTEMALDRCGVVGT